MRLRPTHPLGAAAVIESINALVRTSQRMLTETGRAPTPEELAEKLAIPAEKVRRLLEIASANLDRVQGQLGLTGND